MGPAFAFTRDNQRKSRMLHVSIVRIAISFIVLGCILPASGFADQAFIGKFQYEDREFDFRGFTGAVTPRPIPFADVRIVSGSSTIATGSTTGDGSFYIQAPDSMPRSLRAICVTNATMTPGLLIGVRVADNWFSFGDYYSVASDENNTPGYGIVNFGTTVAEANSDAGKAFNIWAVLNDSMRFIASPEVHGMYPDRKLTAIWRFDHLHLGSFYSGPASDRYVYIGPLNAYDDTVITHEIGHFIDDLYSKSDSPGGIHYIGHDDQDIRLSWAEGLATFLGSSIREFLGYPRPEIYVETDGTHLNFSFETERLDSSTILRSRTGSTNELAVTAALWDIVDGPGTHDSIYGEDDDPLERPFTSVWRVLHNYLPTVTRSGISVENFWDGWFSSPVSNGFLAEMQTIFAGLHGIEYMPDPEEPDDETATAMAAISGQERHHTYYPNGDVDWLLIQALEGETYRFETLNLSNGADTMLDIVAPDGATVVAVGNDPFSAASHLQWTAPSNGTYFLRSYRDPGSGTFARYGSYDLRVSQVPSAPAGSLLTVSRPGRGGAFETLSEAVSQASSGDTIRILDNATYAETLHISGKSLILSAAAGKNPVIDGGRAGSSPVITVLNSPSTRIEGLTVLGGTLGIAIDGSRAVIVNTVFAGASSDGIAVAGQESSVQVINCTIAQNARFGLSIWNNGSANVVNTIFNENAGADVGGDGISPEPSVAYSIISTEPFSGSNQNLTGDPRFADTANRNFRLRPGSPAIDRANPDAASLPERDADGIPRAIDGLSSGTAIPDMGAFEFLPPDSLEFSAIFPQLVSGGTQPKYETTLVAFNPGAAAATVHMSLYGSLGEPLPVNLPDETESERARSSFNLSIAPMGTARMDANTGDLAVGFARYLSSPPVTGTAIVRMFKDNRLHSEAGIALSSLAGHLTIQVDNTRNAVTGYALANPGSSDARLSLFLRDENGEILQTTELVLEAGKHMAEFSDQRFPQHAVAGFRGSIEMVSNQDVAGIALRLDNPELDILSNFPPFVQDPAAVFPLVVDGGGYRTGILILNPSEHAANVKVEFFAEDGTPLDIAIGGARQTGYETSLKPWQLSHVFTEGVSTAIKTGWMQVTSSAPVAGSVVLQTVAGARIVSASGVSTAPPRNRWGTYVESSDTVASGVALCNPNPTAANVTLNLRDTSGKVVDTTRFTIPAFGKIAKFVSGPGQWFPTGFDHFEGSLEIIAPSVPISAAAVRYDNADASVFTTLPLWDWTAD